MKPKAINHRLFFILSLIILAVGYMAYSLFLSSDSVRRPRADADEVHLSVNATVEANGDHTLTIVGTPQTTFLTQGYFIKATFDPTKLRYVELASGQPIQYFLGTRVNGANDDPNATGANTPNTTGVIDIHGEVLSQDPIPLTVNTPVNIVRIRFTPLTQEDATVTLVTTTNLGDTNSPKFTRMMPPPDFQLVPLTIVGTTYSTVPTITPGTGTDLGIQLNPLTACMRQVNAPNPFWEIDYTLHVINNGNTNTGVTEVEANLSGRQPGGVVAGVVPALQPGQVVPVTSSNEIPNCTTCPNANITFFVDPLNEISEINEHNNSVSMDVTECSGTITPTITASPTPTMSPNAAILNLRIKFSGVLTRPTNNTLQVKVSAKRNADTTSMTADGTFTADDSGIWSGTVFFNELTQGSDYKLFVKGPKHLQKKFCTNNPTETEPGTYRCGAGTFTLGPGTHDIDVSNIALPAGDVPENGVQNGVINSYDLAVVKNIFDRSDEERRAPASIAIADLNLDQYVDAQDYSLIIFSLGTRLDEED